MLAFALSALVVTGPLFLAAQTNTDAVGGKVAEEILAAERTFNEAVQQQDHAAVERLIAPSYIGSNQWGDSLNRELYSTQVSTATIQDSIITAFGDVAVHRGVRIVERVQGTEQMLFTRTWVRTNQGWQLFANTQFRDPRVPQPPAPPRQSPITRDVQLRSENAVQAAVRAAEAAYEAAITRHDTRALELMLLDECLETNQRGNTKDKPALLEHFRTSPASMSITSSVIRPADDFAIVSGLQAETGPLGTEQLLFQRLWVRIEGAWRLMASTQYARPISR
jgi:hypothetical protein